jgi:hypothetical protein
VRGFPVRGWRRWAHTPRRLEIEVRTGAMRSVHWSAGMSKVLIGLGLVLVAVGLLWMLGERLGLGRLPGDIVIEREGMRIYIPIATSIIISIALSLLLWFFNR